MRNLEAKFRLDNVVLARERAQAIGFRFSAELIQHDAFFAVPNGKLKLREQPDGCWLIHYRRIHEGSLELSNYEIAVVSEGAKMRKLLAAALGIVAEVRKCRTLLRRGNIRLHLDEVVDLGDFGEIEAVLGDGANPGDYRAEVEEILTALHVRADQLIDASYFELMRNGRGTKH
jgi:predicted adenylyl cyclase CyaB